MVVVGVLECCGLRQSERDLKAAQMNVQRSIIRELLFELSHKAVEANENICWVKSEGAVSENRGTRWFKKCHSTYKNINNQKRSGRFRGSKA